jgi:hydroxyacylglutathione hydrolase
MDCNTYVIKDETTIIIDPGLLDYLPNLRSALLSDGIDPEDIDIIANTHLHADHCWANEAFKELSGAKIMMLPVQKEFSDTATTQTSKFFGIPKVQFKEDGCFAGNKLDIGDMEIEFIHCPGHSPDSIVYYCEKEKFLICGDVIFSYNTGRVDLPGGSAEQLKQSVEKLSELDLEYLLPGHMDIVVGADRIQKNFEYIKKAVFQWL